MPGRHWKRAAMLAATAMTLALAGCNQAPGNQSANSALPALPQAVPMQPGAATPIGAAPAVAALPEAKRVGIAQVAQPSEAYAYLDRADGVFDAIGDAPPDYAYDDGDVSPWAWQTGGGDIQYAEPIDGGYRYYYYQPGADTPYLVRDPDYAYGYSGDQLVAVYDDRGALLPPGAYGGRIDYASRYFARAEYLNRLSREREHRGVIAANWAARRADIAASRAQWAENRAQQAEWQAYHQAHAGQERDHWAAERQQRAAETQRFARWQAAGLHNPPPASVGGPDPRGAMQAQRQQQFAQQRQIQMQQHQAEAQQRQAQAQEHQAQMQQHQAQIAEQRDHARAQVHQQAAQRDQLRQAQEQRRETIQLHREPQGGPVQAVMARQAAEQHAHAAEAGRQQAQAEQRQHMQAEAQQQRAAERQSAMAAHQQEHAAQRQEMIAHAQAAHAEAQVRQAQAVRAAPPHMEAPRPAAPPPHMEAPHPQMAAPHGGGEGGPHHR